MKKKKIMMGIVMILALAMAVSGCAKGKKKDSELEVIDWAIAGLWLYDTEDEILKATEETLNPTLLEKGKDYQIKFHFLTFEKGKLSAEDEETLRKCDLITMNNQLTAPEEVTQPYGVKWHATLADYVDDGLFEPLDEYMNSDNGRKIKERMLTDLTLEPGYWEGKQWLLPTSLQDMTGSSLKIDKKLYDKSGIEIDMVPDFTKCDELFEKFYQTNGRKPFLTFSDRKTVCGINGIPAELPFYVHDMLSCSNSFCMNNGLGVGSIISAENDLDTRNLLKESYFEEYLNAWRRYSENGYVNTNMNEKAMVEIYNSYMPELYIDEWENVSCVIPKSQNYRLNIDRQPATFDPFTGIGAESKKKELSFEAVADLITDKELNGIIHNFTSTVSSEFVFHTGLSEEGEKEYLKLIKEIPQFTHAHTFDSFEIPEIEEINKVYAEYSTEEDDDRTQMVLERHFSKDGKVTEESIHEGIQRLNEKLDEAGTEKFIEALKEQKKKSER